MVTLSWTHPVVRYRRCRGTWGPVAFFRCVGWSWTEICCRKPLGSFKLEHRSQLMNLGIFMIQTEIDIVFSKVSKIADPSAIQKLCKSGVMGSSLIELPGSWQLGKWTKPGPGWKHFEGFTKGSVSQFVVIRKSKLTQLYRLYRNIYIYIMECPQFYKSYIYIIYTYIIYIIYIIYIYIHFLWVIYIPLEISGSRVSPDLLSDAAKAPFVEVAWDLGVWPFDP